MRFKTEQGFAFLKGSQIWSQHAHLVGLLVFFVVSVLRCRGERWETRSALRGRLDEGLNTWTKRIR